MMLVLRAVLFCVFFGCGLALQAQPYLFPGGAVHAASFAPPGTPVGNLPQGGIFSIFGTDIGPATPVVVTSFPLGTTFNGVAIELVGGGGTHAVIPLFLSSGQINALLPSTVPAGTYSLRVTRNGVASNPIIIRVVPHQPGIFTALGSGVGPGSIQNVEAGDARPYNAPGRPAKPGQFIIIWLTGLGPIAAADNNAPPVGNLPHPMEVIVGGKIVTSFEYAGRAPCCAGLDQIVLRLPPDTPLGCWVPLQIRVRNQYLSAPVTLAVSSDNSPCQDGEWTPISTRLRTGGRIGVFSLSRTTTTQALTGVRSINGVAEQLGIVAASASATEFAFEPSLSMPPVGTCTAYTRSGSGPWGIQLSGQPLTAIPGVTFTVTNGSNTRTATSSRAIANALLGVSDTVGFYATRTPPTFTAGQTAGLVVQSGGVGPFQGQFTLPAAATWSGAGSIGTVPRNSDLQLSFSATPAGPTVIYGMSRNNALNVTGMFYCLAASGQSTFTIPAYILGTLPASADFFGAGTGALGLARLEGGLKPAVIPGLDASLIAVFQGETRAVRYR